MSSLRYLEISAKLCDAITESLPAPAAVSAITTSTLTAEWQEISIVLHSALESIFDYSERRHKDWFDDCVGSIGSLIREKNTAHDAFFRNQASSTLCKHFSSPRAIVQRELCLMENEWWLKKARESQSHADFGDTHVFYKAVNMAQCNSPCTMCVVRMVLSLKRRAISWKNGLRNCGNCLIR